MSKALKNRLSNHSVIREVRIIRISAYIVAITFITQKEEIEIEIEAVGSRDIYRSLIAELIGFKINIVLVRTKIDIVLVRIKIDIILVETKEDITLLGIKIDIVLVGTKVDIVLVKTKINIVLVRTETVLVLIGTKIGIL